MTRSKCSLALAAVLAALALALAPSASAQSGGQAVCPGTFEVLHDDRIGGMQLPKGPYTITLLDSSALGCSEASQLFSQFLEDWDGRLPRPWVADNTTRTFTQSGTGVGFQVAPAGPTPPTPPNPPHPPSKRVCAGYFTVLHNDRIGSFRIPKGRYQVILLTLGSYTCSQASSDLGRFLQDYDGVLPRPWVLNQSTASFVRGTTHLGFRIKRYSSSGGTSGGRHPAGGESRCPATFRVLNNDKIGSFSLRRGNYNVWVRGLSCPRASRLFARFLQDFTGVLPRPWVLNTTTGAFTRGRGGSVGLRVKRVR
jgi:hypothetical protein